MKTFGETLDGLKKGMRAYRAGWSLKGSWIAIRVPTPGSDLRLPYIYQSLADGNTTPWTPDGIDLLAGDWETIVPTQPTTRAP